MTEMQSIYPLPREGFVSNEFLDMVEERMAAIREACGYKLDILVENHGRTNTVSAVRMGELVDKYRCYCYEEPCTLLNTDFQKQIRERVRTPIASGERIYTRGQFLNFFQDRSIQLVQPDACNCGGISETKLFVTWHTLLITAPRST